MVVLDRHGQASATVVYSGDRTLRKFCQEHGDIFDVDSTPDSPAFSIRLSTQAPSEEQLLSDILHFVREQGGSVSSECFQGFFGGHRWRREAIPNLKAFFARHTDHFAVEDCYVTTGTAGSKVVYGGNTSLQTCHEATNSPHWRVTLAPSASSAKLAARLAIFLEA